MEKLYAEFLLWFHGFNSGKSYEALLNESFLNSVDADILLDLEECSCNMLNTKGCFMRYWSHDCSVLNPCTFGKSLFAGLKIVYRANTFSIEQYGIRCYRLWQDLPSGLDHTEPFWTLNYADDCLAWGDITQTRMLYEKAFAFYE